MATILFAEEYNFGYNFFAEELKREGYQVASTTNGKALVESIKSVQPDLLIMDVDPCSLKGLDVLQAIRAEHQKLPVIIWATDNNPDFDPRSFGADYTVIKSFNTAELQEKISMALETKFTFASENPGEGSH
ncbi:MAG: response regulator [Desulfarculus sp.]|nr:response regulator [Desulfarculus sp.]